MRTIRVRTLTSFSACSNYSISLSGERLAAGSVCALMVLPQESGSAPDDHTYRPQDEPMTNHRAIHVLIFDGFADWEPAHALAELRRSARRTIRTVGFTGAPIVSMAGLRVMPDLELAAVSPEAVELLILPGGDLWERTDYPRSALESLIIALLAEETPVAAICGGTLALARTHALDDRRHTSNMRSYLPAYASEYAGEAHYVDSSAVRDRHVITASGLASVDFARAIFAELGVFTAQDEALWFDMFKHGRIPEDNITRGERRRQG